MGGGGTLLGTWCTWKWKRSAQACQKTSSHAAALKNIHLLGAPSTSLFKLGPKSRAAPRLTNASVAQQSRSPQRGAERRGAAVTSNDAQAAQKLLYKLLLNISSFLAAGSSRDVPHVTDESLRLYSEILLSAAPAEVCDSF